MVLVSDSSDDSEVLLVSFELEQLLGELEPGAHAPKVCTRYRARLRWAESLSCCCCRPEGVFASTKSLCG